MTAQPPAQHGEISRVLAWAARISRAGVRNVSPAEVAAYLTAKANLLEHIAAERAAGGWSSADIDAARQAADAARRAATRTVTPEDQP